MQRKLIFAIITILVLTVAGGIFFGFGRKGNLPTGEVKIGEQVFRVEVAKDMMSRSRGLSGREKLDEGAGMLFIFDSSGKYGFWMKDMKFAIDIVWILGNKIVGFQENAQPPSLRQGFGGLGASIFGLTTYYPPEAVDKVLELNAGTVAKYGFRISQVVEF